MESVLTQDGDCAAKLLLLSPRPLLKDLSGLEQHVRGDGEAEA